MALSKLYFTKVWTNKSDFPTVETREDQVRSDIQLLHNETQEAFNELVDVLNTALGGGTTGQVLRKKSNADFDFEWVDPS